MKTFTICALLAAGVSAIPMAAPHHAHRHHKRDVVWVTETDIDIVTVPVTKTIWVDASQATVDVNNNQVDNHPHHRTSATTTSVAAPASTVESSSVYSAPPAPSTTSTSSVYVAPTTSTSSVYVASTTTSVYVAPTTSSTSEYVAPTTTSVYVAPTTTSESTPPAYTPTTTYEAPTTTAAPAPTTTSVSSGSGSGTQYVGALSYYEVGLGSCGNTNTDDEMVVALDADMMNKATMCGAKIQISANGVTQEATIVDTCPGCRGNAGLDLSPALFVKFAPTASGIVPAATWSFM